MPRIPRSEQTVGVSARPQPYSVGDGYAAPGRALQQVGQQLSSLALHLQRQDDELETFRAQTAYQEFVTPEDQRRLEADTSLTGDGRGHVERTDTDTDRRFQEFIRQFDGRSRIQSRLTLQYSRDRRRWGARSFAAAQARIEPYYVEQAERHFDANIAPNLFRRHPVLGLPLESGLASVRRGSAMVDQWLGGAAGLPPAVRDRIRQDLVEDIYDRWLQNAGPEADAEREEVVRLLQQRQQGREVRLGIGDEFPEDATERSPPYALEAPGGAEPPALAAPTPGPRADASGVRTSGNGLALIRRLEGFRPAAYWDVSGYSVGYGSFGVDAGTRVTREQAEAMMLREITRIEERMAQRITRPLTQNQHDALVSFFYNLGTGRGRLERIAAIINGGRAADVPAYMRQFTRAGGRHLPALRTRRTEEATLFQSGDGGPMPPGRVRVAEAPSETATDAPGPAATAGPPLPSATEQRVWERIVGNAAEIANFARARARQSEADERMEEVAVARRAANEGYRMLQNLEARRQRDSRTPGITSVPDPAAPELTQEWLDEHEMILRPGAYRTLLNGLTGRGRASVSNSAVFHDLSRMANDPTSHPQVVADLAHDAAASHVLTRRDLGFILDRVRSRPDRPNVETPPAVSDAYRELRRQIGILRPRASAEDHERYNSAVRDLNRYVTEQLRSGTVDARALGERVNQISSRFREGSVTERMQQLQAMPQPRDLPRPPDQATLDDVADARFRLRQRALELQATSPGSAELQQVARDASYLERLEAILTDRFRAANNGRDPPPPRLSAPLDTSGRRGGFTAPRDESASPPP